MVHGIHIYFRYVSFTFAAKVHSGFLSTLTVKTNPKRRARRAYRVGCLAEALGCSSRTIKRLAARHPELAIELRATKANGEWRFNYPKPDSEFAAYLSTAMAAIDSFTEGRHIRRRQRVDDKLLEYIEEHHPSYTDAKRAQLVQLLAKAQDEALQRCLEQQLQRFDEFRRWLEPQVRRAVNSEQDWKRQRKLGEHIGASLCEYMGFGDARRERDVARLELALKVKRTRMDKDDEGRWRDPDYERWDADATRVAATARQIASEFHCPVSDAVKHWREHVEQVNERNRRSNESETARIGALGMEKAAEPFLRDLHLIQTERTFRLHDEASGAVRTFQLRPARTAAQIDAECVRVEGLWPDQKDWPRDDQIRRSWERETLLKAAFELVRDGKNVTGDNLRKLLFRDEQHEAAYKNFVIRQEEETRLAGVPHRWVGQPYVQRPVGHKRKPHERANPFYGERGISRREFNQRYTAQDINAAREATTKVCAFKPDFKRAQPADSPEATESNECAEFEAPQPDCQPDRFETVSQAEIADKAEPNHDDIQLLDEGGRPIQSDEDRDRQKDGFVGSETARRTRDRLQNDEDLQSLLKPERTPQRARIEAVLGVRLDDYLKKPFAEIGSQPDKGRRQGRR